MDEEILKIKQKSSRNPQKKKKILRCLKANLLIQL